MGDFWEGHLTAVNHIRSKLMTLKENVFDPDARLLIDQLLTELYQMSKPQPKDETILLGEDC